MRLGILKPSRWNRHSWSNVAWVVAVGILAMPTLARALDCSWCVEHRSSAEEKTQAIEQNDKLLGKNRQYLTYLDPKEVSKFIKVDSNIKMILVKREKLKRELASVEGEMSEKGCESCSK